MTLAVIGLGSNIDDPPQRLQEASHRLCMLSWPFQSSGLTRVFVATHGAPRSATFF
jgi:7,8-dihydro-6-hydroxymethylpterin-pyrophosphokinase